MVQCARSHSFARAERMSVNPLLGFAPEPVHISVELTTINSPDAATADLYPGQLIGADQRVDLTDADREVGRNVIEGKQAGFDNRPGVLGGSETGLAHAQRLARMTIFTWLCRRLLLFEGRWATRPGEVFASTLHRPAD